MNLAQVLAAVVLAAALVNLFGIGTGADRLWAFLVAAVVVIGMGELFARVRQR